MLYYSINLKRQSEHSGLHPDTSRLVMSLFPSVIFGKDQNTSAYFTIQNFDPNEFFFIVSHKTVPPQNLFLPVVCCLDNILQTIPFTLWQTKKLSHCYPKIALEFLLPKIFSLITWDL